MKKLRQTIRTLDALAANDHLLAVEDTFGIVEECRPLFLEASHADHAESLSDLGAQSIRRLPGIDYAPSWQC
jgi:hypothetical protein